MTILRSSAILYPKQQSFDDLTRQTDAADMAGAAVKQETGDDKEEYLPGGCKERKRSV